MGAVNETQPDPSEYSEDMVVIGGPDTDPPVARDITYVLDRPTSRAYRVVYGTKWIVENLPTVDYIFYLDDDSYLQIPRLFEYLESFELAWGMQEEDGGVYKKESLVLG